MGVREEREGLEEIEDLGLEAGSKEVKRWNCDTTVLSDFKQVQQIKTPHYEKF